MAGGSPTRKGENQTPSGPEHQPDAVARRKKSRFRSFMAQYDPGRAGSAAYRRLQERPRR